MSVLLAAGAALLGAILGSFINALSFRWGTGVSILTGRSRCMRCGTTLSAADLVPVLSWLFLRGRCRYCRVRISAQYPIVELVAALLSFGSYMSAASMAAYAFSLVVWMTLLFVAVYDLRHKIIPWSCSIFLAILGLCQVWGSGFNLWYVIAGPALAAPLVLLWLFSGGRAMGLGDGALELGLGWLLGFTAGLTAFMLAFWFGAAVGIALVALRRGVTIKSEVPFAPFLILGAAAAYFLHVDFFQSLPTLFL